MAICNPTHKSLVLAAKGVLPTHDYTVVIRQARWPGEKALLSEETTDGQKFSQALLQMIKKWLNWEADIQGQIEIQRGFLLEGEWFELNCALKQKL